MPHSDMMIPIEPIENRILFLRNQRVILDAHLAELYGVTANRLLEQVTRNKERFPNDFVFQLNKQAASIYVVRAFVRLRQFPASHKELADKLADLEQQVGTHDKAIVSEKNKARRSAP